MKKKSLKNHIIINIKERKKKVILVTVALVKVIKLGKKIKKVIKKKKNHILNLNQNLKKIKSIKLKKKKIKKEYIIKKELLMKFLLQKKIKTLILLMTQKIQDIKNQGTKPKSEKNIKKKTRKKRMIFQIQILHHKKKLKKHGKIIFLKRKKMKVPVPHLQNRKDQNLVLLIKKNKSKIEKMKNKMKVHHHLIQKKIK